MPKQPSKSKQSEDLISEAHANLKADRAKITEFSDLLEKAAKMSEEIDPLAKIAMVESFTRLASELTKNNALLLDLVKIRVKKEAPVQPTRNGFSEDEADTMFDEIDSDEDVPGDEGSN